jgi:hypothetical protein
MKKRLEEPDLHKIIRALQFRIYGNSPGGVFREKPNSNSEKNLNSSEAIASPLPQNPSKRKKRGRGGKRKTLALKRSIGIAPASKVDSLGRVINV